MARRVLILLVSLLSFATLHAETHSTSTNSSSPTFEFSDTSNFATVISESLYQAQTVFNSLRERFERNDRFGETASDIELEDKLHTSLRTFFDALKNLGVSINFEAHDALIRSLEKAFNSIKADDPDKKKKEDAIRNQIETEYLRVMDELSVAQFRNEDVSKNEAFINAKETIKLIAAIHQNILNMKKATTEQAKPSPSPDPIRTAIGVGGLVLGGELGRAIGEGVYDSVVGNTPNRISHDRAFVEPPKESDPDFVGPPAPPKETAPKVKPTPGPVAENPKTEENPPAQNEPPKDEPSHQPNETAANTTPPTTGENTAGPIAGNTTPPPSTPPPSSNIPSGTQPSTSASIPSSPSTSTPSTASINGSGPNSNSRHLQTLDSKKNRPQNQPANPATRASEIPELPVKRPPVLPPSPDSPARPYSIATNGSFSSMNQPSNSFSNPNSFFAPPTDSAPPQVSAPGEIPEPILGVTGTRQRGAPQVTGPTEGFDSGVKIVGRKPSSIESTPNSQYKRLVGNFDPPKISAVSDSQSPESIKTPTGEKAPELQDPYIYSPGFEPKEIDPLARVGEVTTPTKEEINLASGIASAIKVLTGDKGIITKVQEKGILEALQEIVKANGNETLPVLPGTKAGDLKRFLLLTKKKQLSSISRILTALKGF